ncbi:hypothetical protein [Hymenobacter sublimis]|uniref:Uncharacterized protein n=1 Tax=Hymenobacter sublimis TaxID=2933777 RepID=A0ABY4JBN2_9BACT|nr:hypothetical protein [Hymenobacter sublimis]UPL50226.1 hypothetical protein MWH26_04785 [Hymenobacter sublimis]
MEDKTCHCLFLPDHLRAFTSNDPYVAELANEIEAAYPGHVISVNRSVYRPNGQIATDYDIETSNAVIQVKSVGNGLVDQILRTEQTTSKPVIGYGPKLKPSVVKSAQSRELLVTKDKQLLIDVLNP